MGLLKPNGIVAPQMVGGDCFHIGRNLHGEFIFNINGQTMTMSPAQTVDLAVRLLKANGMEIEPIEQQAAAAPGPRLLG